MLARLATHLRRALPQFAAALLGVAALATAGSAVSAPARHKSVVHTVIIQNVQYEPATLTIRVGDTVVWVNKDLFAHTVTAAGSFDSHTIDPGHSWTYVARKAGHFAYICTLHPNMMGTLQVE